MSADHVIGRS